MRKAKTIIFLIWHILLVCGLILGGVAYYRTHRDLIAYKKTAAEQKQVLEAQKQDLKGAEKRIAERDKEALSQQAKIEVLKATPATVQEIVKEIAVYVPLKGNPTETAIQEAGKAAATGLQFNAEQAAELRNFYLNCAGLNNQLSACQGDAKDFNVKEMAYQNQIKILTAERNSAVSMIKGGSFFTRLKREGKDIAVGVAVGAAIGYAAHH